MYPALPFNGIILAHSNESEWVTFRNNKNNEAFLNSIYIVKVPAACAFPKRSKSPANLLDHSELTHAPCAPGTLKHCHVFHCFAPERARKLQHLFKDAGL
ncbi:hypothetical protein ACLB1O_07820 [Escherichia coli]